jgi:type IV pilus biogenesis protein CpaD/CtpE
MLNDKPRPIKWETKAGKISTPIDINFKRRSSKLYPSTKEAIRATMTTPRETYFRLYVDNMNASKDLTKTRINNIIAYLHALNIPNENIDVFKRSDDIATLPNSITLMIDHYQVIRPKCPGWQQEMNTTVPPEGEINFRCTNESNFSAMIADPRVLITGNELSGADANRSSKAVDAYQAGTVKEIKIEKIENKSGG